MKRADIVSDVLSNGSEGEQKLTKVFPKGTKIWLDSSDMYSGNAFFRDLLQFQRVFLDTPLSYTGENEVQFNIAPQPSFNKNFEILTEDIRSRI